MSRDHSPSVTSCGLSPGYLQGSSFRRLRVGLVVYLAGCEDGNVRCCLVHRLMVSCFVSRGRENGLLCLEVVFPDLRVGDSRLALPMNVMLCTDAGFGARQSPVIVPISRLMTTPPRLPEGVVHVEFESYRDANILQSTPPARLECVMVATVKESGAQ